MYIAIIVQSVNAICDNYGNAAVAVLGAAGGGLLGTALLPYVGLGMVALGLIGLSYYLWQSLSNENKPKAPTASDIDWGEQNTRHHIISGTNGRHILGWQRFGINPNGNDPWVAILPILKDTIDNADKTWQKTLESGGTLYYYAKYYVEEGVRVVVKIFESADGTIRRISDAIPEIIR